jgi:hypothetical protein
VVQYHQPETTYELQATRRYGQMVLIEPLQPWWGHDPLDLVLGRTDRTLAMDSLIIPQQYLERIEPPADTAELLAEFKLPDEHCSMEDLGEYVNNKENLK